VEGSFIPAPGSSKLIIANHPLGFSRSGIPTHLQPWHADWAPSGNGFEVDLVPNYKILHDAGYHVLAYDLRNHGLTSAANGGVVTHGFTENRDVAGSLDYGPMGRVPRVPAPPAAYARLVRAVHVARFDFLFVRSSGGWHERYA